MMTVLQRMDFINQKRRRSASFTLSAEDAMAYEVLLTQRRARVKEMVEAGRVVENGTSQTLEMKRREKTQRVMEYRESREQDVTEPNFDSLERKLELADLMVDDEA